MSRSPLCRGGVILIAFVVAGCNFTPTGNGPSIASARTPTPLPPADALGGGSFIEPYVPEATVSTSDSIHVPQEIEPPADLLPIAQAIAEAVNRLRVATGVEPLVIDDGLTRIAFARSADMVVRGYLSHEDPLDGSNLPYRLLTSAGYGGLLGENVFASKVDLEELVNEAVDGWLRSPAHRATAMDPRFHFTGVGVLSDGEWWKVTQVFAGQLP